ncbi:hypothetical protein [Salinisphaera orenii]|uniref:hypothetical protein n=1 Tax=Salinisphaera orenii TaxID=856731 RepID=UPI000DBE0926
MQKKLYLHIGASKTGTSSLQSYLNDHRDWLQKQGFLVPKSERYNHHPLVQSILWKFSDYYKSAKKPPFQGNYASLWQRFHAEVEHSECPVVLVSSEMFPALADAPVRHQSDTMIRWLGEQLKDFDVRVVCYLRPLDRSLKSQYKYFVKDRRVHLTMAEWVCQQLRHRSIYTEPTTYLDRFVHQFGADNLILRYYDRSNLVNENVIDDFFDLIGLSSQVDRLGDRESHPSLPDQLLDMKRIFNELARPSADESFRIGRTLARQSTTTFDASPADGGRAISEALQNEHKKLAENYGLDLGEVGDPFGETDSGSIEAQGQTVLISELYKQVRESQKTLDELQTEVKELRAQNDKPGASQQIKQSHARLEKLIRNRTSISKRFRGVVRKLLKQFSPRANSRKVGADSR